MNDTSEAELFLNNSEAILAVSDVEATVKFYREVLGFRGHWLWGTPPTFAGLSWGKIQIMLCHQPELAAKVDGHQHFFRCSQIDRFYELHRRHGAPIISAIEDKPWGVREYTIRDINGYLLRFAGAADHRKPASAPATMPEHITIEDRMPTLEEYAWLVQSVGWNREDSTAETALRNSILGVVAIDRRDGQAVGCARVVGDGARFFYIQDVMVIPSYQNQRIGHGLLIRLTRRLREIAPSGASVGLFTGKPKFYEAFGFKEGGGMSMTI